MPAYRADEVHPPAARFDAELLEHALRATVAEVCAPIPDELGGGRVRWGDAARRPPAATGDERGEIAGYLAKYATKSTEQAGGAAAPRRAEDVDHAPCASTSAVHAHRVRARRRVPRSAAPRGGSALDVETDWHPAALAVCAPRDESRRAVRVRRTTAPCYRPGRALSTRPSARGRARDRARLRASMHLGDVASIGPRAAAHARSARSAARRCAHALGYRGHCLTKSRRYSTTFKALREAREAYVHEQMLARSPTRPSARSSTRREQRTRPSNASASGISQLRDAYLAASAAARAREERATARLARAMEFETGGRGERDGHTVGLRRAGRALAAIIAGDESGLRRLAELLAPYLPVQPEPASRTGG